MPEITLLGFLSTYLLHIKIYLVLAQLVENINVENKCAKKIE